MEIYKQKSIKTPQWYATTINQEKINIMLDSATPYSIIPSDSYLIEWKTKTNFRLYPLQLYL